MVSDSSIWPGFCRGRSGLTWIPRSAPSVPRLVGPRTIDLTVVSDVPGSDYTPRLSMFIMIIRVLHLLVL
jgi:hypothetical protein